MTKSILAHLIPAKGTFLPSCEKVVDVGTQRFGQFGVPLSGVSVSRRAFHFCTAQETAAEGDPQSNGAAESSVHVVTGNARPIRLAVESASGVEVSADRDLFTWAMLYVTSLHRRFAVARDGKTAHERSVGLWEGAQLLHWHSLVSGCDGCQCSHQAAIRALCKPALSKAGLGPMDGSSTVLIGIASGFSKTRTIKRFPPGERGNGSLWGEARCSDLTPNALEADGEIVGI